ncbi:MAG: hypothetical protein Q7T80_17530, partial [Methanoregula sp.]|nr:hypothetical protein [Methanoregula sp.]
GKVFEKNSNSLRLLRFFEVSVDCRVRLVDDHPIFTEEILEKYWSLKDMNLKMLCCTNERKIDDKVYPESGRYKK